METIDLIDKLIPLLESGGEAAFWLIVLHILKGYFSVALTTAFGVFFVWALYRTILMGSTMWRITSMVAAECGFRMPIYGSEVRRVEAWVREQGKS